MAIPEQVLSEIKYRNQIEDVIAPYVSLKHRGKNLVGLCPFHNEKTPSFTVYPENGSFYCFGCGAGGDVFTFIKLIENLDYIEAVKLLAERAGVVLPESGSYDDSMQQLKSRILEINRESAKFFHSYLMSPAGKWGLDYLTGRGLTVATMNHFGLGAAPDSWDALLKHLKSRGFTEEDMLQANVIGKSGKGGFYDRFRRRIIFPVIDIRGHVIAFSGRKMPDDTSDTGKYVNTADTPVYKKSDHLFGMNFAKSDCRKRIILVEGNMDVVSLHQAGFTMAVAALGTAFTEQQAKLISRYTTEIVLTMDADAAGQKAVRRAGEILKHTGLTVRVITIPDGKDPDEFIKKNGPERFAALLDGAVSEIEYKLLGAAQNYDLETDNGKVQYLNDAAKILADTPDVLTRDFYIGRMCEQYGVSRVALESKVKDLCHNIERRRQKKMFEALESPHFSQSNINPERQIHPRACAAEETVLAILLQHPNLLKNAFEKLQQDDMVTTLNRRIYRKMYALYMQGNAVDISAFGELLSDAELGYLVALQNSDRARQNESKLLADCISVLQEEQAAIHSASAEDLSVDDWAKGLQSIIQNKKGNKNGKR